MSSTACLLISVLLWGLASVVLATSPGQETCRPLDVQTAKGPIKVECSTACQQSGQNVQIRRIGEECVSITVAEHRRMGTARHSCPLGTCQGDACQQGNLRIECWKNCA
uniref:Evasin n=1 Tax=Amblyomma tuberculatum TaxID=48802 RepID=A0A6M2E1V3_9ACAR